MIWGLAPPQQPTSPLSFSFQPTHLLQPLSRLSVPGTYQASSLSPFSLAVPSATFPNGCLGFIFLLLPLGRTLHKARISSISDPSLSPEARTGPDTDQVLSRCGVNNPEAAQGKSTGPRAGKTQFPWETGHLLVAWLLLPQVPGLCKMGKLNLCPTFLTGLL